MDGNGMQSCQWPEMREPYHTALREAVAHIFSYCTPLGIVASGTIIRGNPSPNSDLDLYVLVAENQRQRIQKLFNGVPAEIFNNPFQQVEKYLAEERLEGMMITAHMLSTGHVIFDNDERLPLLVAKARQLLAEPPNYSPSWLVNARYMAATLYEDAQDIAGVRPEACGMLLSAAVRSMLQYYYLKNNLYIPREKWLMDDLAGRDNALADCAVRFWKAGSMEKRLSLAEKIADATIATRGFFEWASGWEVV
jgi:predicted nucleotidyltransferase